MGRHRQDSISLQPTTLGSPQPPWAGINAFGRLNSSSVAPIQGPNVQGIARSGQASMLHSPIIGPASDNSSVSDFSGENQKLGQQIEVLLQAHGEDSVVEWLSHRLPGSFATESSTSEYRPSSSLRAGSIPTKADGTDRLGHHPAQAAYKRPEVDGQAQNSVTEQVALAKPLSIKHLTRAEQNDYRPIGTIESQSSFSSGSYESATDHFVGGIDPTLPWSRLKLDRDSDLANISHPSATVSMLSDSKQIETAVIQPQMMNNEPQYASLTLVSCLWILYMRFCLMCRRQLRKYLSHVHEGFRAAVAFHQRSFHAAMRTLARAAPILRMWTNFLVSLTSCMNMTRFLALHDCYTALQDAICPYFAIGCKVFPTFPTSSKNSQETYIYRNQHSTIQIVSFGWWAITLWMFLATYSLKTQWEHGNSIRARKEVPLWNDENWALDSATYFKASLTRIINGYAEPISDFT